MDIKVKEEMMTHTNISVSFAIIGDINPEEITSVLKIQPSKVLNKGEMRRGGMISKTSIWELKTDYVKSTELSEQFKILIVESGLLNEIDELKFIKNSNNVFMRLDVAINVNINEKPIIWIEPTISKFASELDINIDISTYFEDY